MVDLDVVVVGAGFSGIYAVHAFRSAGLTVRAFEAGDGIGGTWFWNSYPGARCDVESKDYSYSFSPELEQEWSWSERYPAQPEILRYLNHVADKFGLWPHIQLNTRVTGAAWDAARPRGRSRRRTAATVTARFFVSAVGLPVGVPGAGPAGARRRSRALVPHRAVAEGRRRLHRQAGRAHRHRVDRDPGRAGDRGRRRAPVRVPADARTSRCRTGTGRGTEAEERAFKSGYREYRAEARESFLGVPITGTGRPVAGRAAGGRAADSSRSGGGRAAACRSSARTPTCS